MLRNTSLEVSLDPTNGVLRAVVRRSLFSQPEAHNFIKHTFDRSAAQKALSMARAHCTLSCASWSFCLASCVFSMSAVSFDEWSAILCCRTSIALRVF